jgi:Skp family chaperone for outer membrane proteins
VKRLYVGMVAVALAAGTASAQAPAGGGAPAAAPPSRGPAVFNVARVMKDYQKWQYFAAQMNKERMAEASKLANIRNQVMNLENDYKKETIADKKLALEQQMTQLQRQFEDMEKTIRKNIDEKSAVHLKTLFTEIRTVVDAVAKTNGFELVLAYPDALTQEEMNSPVYFDIKMRPPAAMPFYVSPSIDITMVVVQTLNKNFPAPGPIEQVPAPGVSNTGGTAPAAPPATPPGGMK